MLNLSQQKKRLTNSTKSETNYHAAQFLTESFLATEM